MTKIKTIRAKHRRSFYIILILLPFLLLALIETMLRISQFGSEIPLFKISEDFSDYLQPNPDIIKRYFPPDTDIPNVSPDTQFFKKIKDKDSFRIVIQGGSTAAGFPFGRWGSLKGMLDQKFKRLYPEKNIEIINTAMSAVNSYTLLDFTDEIIDLKPDLVLIYAGHNEYLGVMGVGSAFASKGGRAATLLSLKLKNLRLYQLLQRLIFSSAKKPTKDTDSRTLMSKIAKEKNISIDSSLYQKGIEQFSGNLEMILSSYQQHNIPVMIATLVSNEKDQPPFASAQASENSISADKTYEKALLLLKSGKKHQAHTFFQKARDLDLLRFRAPGIFNQIIKNKASKYHAFMVDVEQYFIKYSPDGIPGNYLILEHLHPNLTGYYYLADAFSKAMIKHHLLPSPLSEASSSIDFDDIPVSKSDRLYGLYKIKKLKSGYPFTDHPYEVTPPTDNSLESIALRQRIKGESWLSIQQKLLTGYQQQRDYKEAAKIASLITDAIPEQHQSAYIAGQLYAKISKINSAIYNHRKAVNIKPDDIHYLLSLAQDYYKIKNYDKSLNTLSKVLNINPQNKAALFYSKKIKQLQKGLLH